ncbi:GDP-mannose 4,6-dehydratase [Metabacillus idriensis]|uniref:GDP-mannose 4,6-dehydratase n=1 Tax=Metabacillus idriensis TaxID=324768 RepID=UPI003D26568A
MKTLITGGAGFIGSHLAIRLLKSGNQPILLDNLDLAERNPRKLYQLQQVNRAGSVPYYECDLLDREKLMSITKMEKPEAIVHLGALAGVSPSLQNPSAYIDVNIQGTNHILACAGEHQVKHVIFASSSSVYGEQFDVPLSEDMVTGRVLSPYAASKMGAESLCHAYRHMYGFQLNILRFFTVYGPWGRPDMAFSTFIRRIMNNQNLSIFGQGTGRDYTYIDDIVTGIMLTLGSSESDVYNLGSGRPVLMTEVINQLRSHFPNVELQYGKARKGDVTSTWADISKARLKLGYNPSISFKEGFEQTVAWAKEHPDII